MCREQIGGEAFDIQRSTVIAGDTRQSQTADSAPGVATSEVTLSAREAVPCVR